MSATDFTKQPVTFVEILPDRCTRTYGVSPCTAVVGTTGDDRCYNTFCTCQDAANYAIGTLTLRFSMQGMPRVPGQNAYPCITGMTTVPTLIDQRRGLGAREMLKVDMIDFMDEDVQQDPYYRQRSNRTARRFFARLLRRNRTALKGRTVKVREGYLDPDGTLLMSGLNDRTYVVESLKLSARGKVTLTAKDPLKLLDGVMIPTASDGEITATMAVGATSVSVKAGQGAQYGSAPFYFRIGDEIMKCTTIATDAFSVVERAQAGTTAEEHAADSKVQIVRAWTADQIDDIWEDILLESGVPAANYDKTSFTTSVDAYLSSITPEVYISEPTRADKLLSDLMMQTNCYTFWDAEAQTIEAVHVQPLQIGESLATLNDDDNIIGDSLSVEVAEDQRLTRSTIAHGVIDWSAGLEEPQNYLRHTRYIDTDAESANEYGDEKARTLWAYWLPSSTAEEVNTLAYRLLTRYRDAPQIITCDLEVKDADSIQVGERVEMTAYLLVDDAGAPLATECLVIGKRKKSGRQGEYTYTLETINTSGRFGFWAPDGTADYPTDETYGHLADETTEEMPNGDRPYAWG